MPTNSKKNRTKKRAPTAPPAAAGAQGDTGSDGHRIGSLNVCSWQWDLLTNRVCWSEELCRMVGIESRDVPGTLEDFLALVHPDDHETVRNDIHAILAGASFEHELRFIARGDGVVRAQTRGIPISDRSGEVVSVVGLCREDTSRPSPSRWAGNGDLLLAQAEQIANFGTWEFDVRTRTATLSPHFARMLGLEPGVKISEEEYWAKVHADDRPRAQEIANAGIASGKTFHIVSRYLFPGGRVRHHFVWGLPIHGNDGRTEYVAGVTLDFSDQTHAEGELHRLSQQLLRARDEERRNIARDLHESAGQTLVALKMSLGRLREALPEGDETCHELLSSSVNLAQDAVREVRTISYLMHPPMLDEAGVGSALRWYVKGFAERSGISVQVDIPDDFGRYGREIETTLFRIVQEALTNVHRYSGSRTASISLSRRDGVIFAEVHDEGCGLPALHSAAGRNVPLGVGIVGMRERVKQLDGSFQIESTPGKGTTVRAVLPVDVHRGQYSSTE